MRLYGRAWRVPVILAAVALSACSARQGGRPISSRNILTATEIERTNASTALDAVQTLRPYFLTTRGSQSIQDPNPPRAVVYLDGMRLGPPNTLAMINASSVVTIEYLSAIEASSRFGMGHGGGAILVTTKR